MRRRNTIILLLFTVLLAVIIGQDFIYPSQWNDIHLDMTRQEVESLAGQSRDKDFKWQGHFWNDSGILIKNEILVFTTNDKVSSIIQRQLLITGQTIRIIRVESKSK